LKRHELELKAKLESNTSYFSVKRPFPVGFNVGFTGSACIALPVRAGNTSPLSLSDGYGGGGGGGGGDAAEVHSLHREGSGTLDSR
jgi:hypothetical protein